MPSEQDEQARQRILEAFGLSNLECRVKNLIRDTFKTEEEGKKNIKENNIYVISPKQPYKEKLPIREINNSDIFNEYNLVFRHFIFEVELLIQQKTITKCLHFRECTFKKHVGFDNSTFHGMVLFDVDYNSIHIPFKQSVFESTLSCNKTIFNDMVDFSKSEFSTMVFFQGATFNEYAHFREVNFKGEADFFNATFNREAIFSGAHFQLTVDFRAIDFCGQACFKNVMFDNEATFERDRFEKMTEFNGSTFRNKVNFQDIVFCGLTRFAGTIFYNWVSFGGSTFKERAFFSKAHFQGEASLSNVIFDHNAYFDEAEFLGEAKFKQSEFYKNAHFYETRFKEVPNFIQAIFNENINFTNTELNIDFDKTRETIEKIYAKKEKLERYKIANEFRDSFRTIKSALIKDNNMLDASNYHRVELYCKELELDYKQKEEIEKSTIRDLVDRIQLLFHRLTSDHHTDLLLILNNVIILIACFGLTNFILNILLNQNYFDFSGQKVFMAIGAFFINGIFILMTLFLILNCWKGFSFSIDWLKNKLQAFKILKDSLNTKANFRTYLVLASYCIMAIIFAVNPALFLPILGQLLDSKLYIGFTFTSLNIAYAILMFLLIWSLQKTARKNTIVPN